MEYVVLKLPCLFSFDFPVDVRVDFFFMTKSTFVNCFYVSDWAVFL